MHSRVLYVCKLRVRVCARADRGTKTANAACLGLPWPALACLALSRFMIPAYAYNRLDARPRGGRPSVGPRDPDLHTHTASLVLLADHRAARDGLDLGPRARHDSLPLPPRAGEPPGQGHGCKPGYPKGTRAAGEPPCSIQCGRCAATENRGGGVPGAVGKGPERGESEARSWGGQGHRESRPFYPWRHPWLLGGWFAAPMLRAAAVL